VWLSAVDIEPVLLYDATSAAPPDLASEDRDLISAATPLAHQAPYAGTTSISSLSNAELRDMLTKHQIVHPDLDQDVQKMLIELLVEYRHCFALSVEDLTVPAKFEPVIISGIDPGQVVKAPYRSRFSEKEKQAIHAQVEVWERVGIVESVVGTLCTINNLLCVNKKDDSIRLCLDPRPLNSITVPDSTLPPLVEDALNKLVGACIFSALD